jgi:glycosyltransferase involved in cell wall biosynthesis
VNGLRRVAYLVSHPIHYQAPLLRYIQARNDIDLHVFFLRGVQHGGSFDPGFGRTFKWDVPLRDGYSSEELARPEAGIPTSFLGPLVPALEQRLSIRRFDALWLHGYAHQVFLRAFLQAARASVPIIYRSEGYLKARPSSALKTRFLTGLFARIGAFLTIGTRNREYYRHHGVTDDRMFDVPYAVDNEFFRTAVAKASQERHALKQQLGLEPGRPVILYCAKLQRRKRPFDLLDAYAGLSPARDREPDPYLLFVGDGELGQELHSRVEALSWSSIKVLGFKNQTELPAYEPWGMVLIEIVNARKPVVVSDQVGAGTDLVRDGENGFVFPVGDVKALTTALRTVTADPQRAARMGALGAERVAAFSFANDHKGLMAALESVWS